MSLRFDRSHSRAAIASAALLCATLGAPVVAAAQEPTARPATHTVKRGDTLWDLAKLYLGDAFLWPEIYRINTDKIEDPHWIYPGELLKLPGEAPKTIAAAPTPPVAEPTVVVTPVRPVTPAPALALAPPPQPAPEPVVQRIAPAPTVRMGEYIASPWVERQGGPLNSGYLIQGRDLPGIESSGYRSRLALYDRVMLAPPAGSVAAENELYLTYRMGPFIEDLGQIVIPTGIVAITRSARNGEAAVGELIQQFGEVQQGQHLIPLDTAAAVLAAHPQPIRNGKSGKVRWLYNSPVLPSIQNYVVFDISRRDVTTGDRIDLYYPRQGPVDGRDLALPEVWIGRAQVLRVTPFGATAIIVLQEQPSIREGTAVRVAEKMP